MRCIDIDPKIVKRRGRERYRRESSREKITKVSEITRYQHAQWHNLLELRINWRQIWWREACEKVKVTLNFRYLAAEAAVDQQHVGPRRSDCKGRKTVDWVFLHVIKCVPQRRGSYSEKKKERKKCKVQKLLISRSSWVTSWVEKILSSVECEWSDLPLSF